MSSRISSLLLGLFLVLGLAGCNFPLSRSAAEKVAGTSQSATLSPEESALAAGSFDPLKIDCLVGTWEVDSDSLLYAANMLVGDAGVSLTNVSPHMFYRVAWDESLPGSTYTMETWFIDVLISGAITVGDSEHTLDLVLNGATTAYFSASETAGEFVYQNDPERSTIKISSLKMDGLPMPAGMIPLDDLLASISSSTMYYSCQSPEVITLRDQNAVEPVTLHLVSAESLPTAP